MSLAAKLQSMSDNHASRIAFLRDLVSAAENAAGPTAAVPFRQQQLDLRRIQVPIDFPLYRLQNGRTHRAHAAYIESRDLPEDFFADPESEDAQAAQGEILRDMMDEANLRQNLHDNQQRVPLVLTYDGFIVDGNRRTATLRAEGSVEQMTAVVLPEDASAQDLYKTELELQMAVETKADYNWVDEAVHIRWGVKELGESTSAIARRMGIPEKRVKDLLGRLSLVDVYLDWLGASGKYHRVPTDERSAARQSFEELHQREQRQTFRALSELQRRAVLHACFVLIKESGGYENVRRVADGLIKQPAEIVRRLKDELPEDLSTRLDEPPEAITSAASSNESDSLLEQLATADQPTDTPAGAELLNIVDDPEESASVVTPLAQVAEDLAEQNKEDQQKRQPLKNVERALRSLEDIKLDDTTPRLPDIASTLAQVIAKADELAEQVDELTSS